MNTAAPCFATSWNCSSAPLRLLLAAALLLACASAAGGQQLRVRGGVDHPAPALLLDVLARGNYRVLDRDTLLPATFQASGDLLVVDAAVRLEGRVEGDVAVVGGALFLRPGAAVGGSIALLNGQLLGSEQASTGPVLELPAEATARLSRENGATILTLSPPPAPPRLQLQGAFGVLLPTYDRVDGLTLRAGAALAFSSDSVPARLLAQVSYRTARGRPGGEVALEAPFAREWWAHASAGRATRTNEAWIRDPLSNSLGAVLFGLDEHDHFESDELRVGLVRRPRRPLVQGEGVVSPRLTLRVSRDRSLTASDPWSLTGGQRWRANPPIEPGTLASVLVGAGSRWRGATSSFAGDLAVEWAPGAWGDFRFAYLVADGTWEMLALWGHTIRVRGRVQEPLTAGGAPPQRWSFVGGPGTLPTLETAALRGDHLAFIQSDYLAPLLFLPLPVLGAPSLRLVHATGTAWATGTDSPRWPQALGVGLQFPVLSATLFVDPAADRLRPVLSLGTSWPR